jgi:glycosyltransferase involved in cell wall biosynthesis
MKRVAFLCKTISQYRQPFFDKLKLKLEENNVQLQVIYGQGPEVEQKKEDSVHIPWADFVPNKIIRVFDKELIWQPVLSRALQADLVIVEQANSLIVNYFLQMLQIVGRPKLAFWGHGKNFQAQSSDRFSELLKKFLATRVYWWFAYTESTRHIVTGLGFPSERVTVTWNAIDTEALRRLSNAITEEDCSRYRSLLQISENTCIFCGGLYKEKRLDFLIDAAVTIREVIPDFCLLIVGSGPDKQVVVEAAKEYQWIKYLGPLFGEDKVKAFRAGKLTLMPGLVGLAILDSFVLGAPPITTNVPFHSPEIAYLENGINGIMTSDRIADFAGQVIALLQDEEALNNLRSGARLASELYTIEIMVDNFAQGILEALNSQ